MENEKRLIDANTLIEILEEIAETDESMYFHLDEITQEIFDTPTVEAVEVVRCKDCKFYKDSPMGGKGCHTHFNGRTEFIPKNDNDFCSYGEKKIDEQKDC